MAFISLNESHLARTAGKRLPSGRTMLLMSAWILLAIPLAALAGVAWFIAKASALLWRGVSGPTREPQRLD